MWGFSSSNFTFYTVTSGELPRLLYLNILEQREAGGDQKQIHPWERGWGWQCQTQRMQPSHESEKIDEDQLWQMVKSRFKWGCIPCWQGGECYPNLKHMCALVFLIHIYHIFSVPPHSPSLPLFLSFKLTPFICHLCFQTPLFPPQITSELWRPYLSLSQQLFFSYPPGSFWKERASWIWSPDPGWWPVSLWPVRNFQRTSGMCADLRGTGELPNQTSKLSQERNVCGNWE